MGNKLLTVYVPTKGRPHNALRLQEAFRETTTCTRLVFILSDNDAKLNEYLTLSFDEMPIIITPKKPGFIDPLNQGFLQDHPQHKAYAVGFMGDDHLPRTPKWDEKFLDHLLGVKCGMVYGNDLLQYENLPTHIIMTSNIPSALGYMTLPQLSHLFGDNFWMDLGQRLRILKYFPEIIIEHLHPGNGKASVDAGYRFSGNYELHKHDSAIYQEYLDRELNADVSRVTRMILENK